MAIKSFKCADTESLFHFKRVPRFVAIQSVALRRLTQLDVTERLDDLRAPPGNRLESLAGDRAGQWSIRINDRYRICFVWRDRNAEEVEIVDYH
jgi:toxin HigB-1